MANKDYVKRGRGAPKKTARKPASKRKPWRSGLLAILLLGGFSYGLYTLSTDPKPIPKAESKAQAVKVHHHKSSKKALPPPPTEKWEYVKSLPKREVEVVAKEQKISKVPYIMQCGAYKTSKQANSRKAMIAFQGIKSTIRKKADSSWYRVVLGPYVYRRNAERDRHILQRAKIEPCAVWKDNQ